MLPKFSIFERTFSWLLSVVMIFGLFVVANVSETEVGAAQIFYWPLDTNHKITTGFYGYKDHNGCDMACASGTPIYATFDGTAVYYQKYTMINGVKTLTSFGNCVYLTSHDQKYMAIYAHMNAFEGFSLQIPSTTTKQQSGSSGTITIGSRTVSEGDVLGWVGKTGNATGNHLHYGLKVDGNFVDPSSYLNNSMSAKDHGHHIDFIEDTSYAVPVSLKAKYKDNTYDSNGNIESNRWIDAGDDCYIEKVYTNGFCRVEYPAGNDRRWAYAKASLFDVPKKANKPSATYVSVSAGTNFAPTSFWWNASENVDHYDLKIWNGTYWEGDAYKIEWGIKGTSCSLQLPTGYYEAYVDSVNSEGCTMSENVVRFTVGDEKIDIGTDFYAYIINTSAWKMATVVDDNVQLQSETGKGNQIWYFQRQDDCSYKISNVDTKNCLAYYVEFYITLFMSSKMLCAENPQIYCVISKSEDFYLT